MSKENTKEINERLEYLRGEIEAERISVGEIAELESLAEYIEPGDVLLLEWAGVPEDKPVDDIEKLLEKKLKNINRVEVVDHTLEYEEGGGRAYSKWRGEGTLDVKLFFQDKDRTLKVWITPKEVDSEK